MVDDERPVVGPPRAAGRARSDRPDWTRAAALVPTVKAALLASACHPTGAPGADGQSIIGPEGDTGPAGPPGTDGKNGKDDKGGADGQTCPDGYSLQAPPDDPDALVCRRTGAETPSPDQSRNLLGLGAHSYRHVQET
ncbi:hypothetical protein ACFVYE_21900 [Streptomyces sp. NPDC058239]|uniref:hypothetical protein n=1 Tax=Streptomyces sp. NPDC058239 TaxID=3346395 RepID=UPI0036DFF750